MPDGKTIVLDVNPFDTASNLKQKVHDKEGYRLNQQRLLFCGKDIENTSTLDDLRITNESTIHMTSYQRGGMNFAKARSMFERNPKEPKPSYNNCSNGKEYARTKTMEKTCAKSDYVMVDGGTKATGTGKNTFNDLDGIVQLVELDGHFPTITAEANRFFKHRLVESRKIALVTIAGQVGTGKSFLSECLTGRKGVFHVAHQTKSCTMGAQMGQLMPVQSFGVENKETLVGIIDLQGQGDGTVSRDINVSVPMLMISSVLIFNCPPGRPAKGDFLNRFAVMLECAKKIKPKNSNNVFGNLIIVCRDCNLDEEEIFTEFFEDEDEEDVDTHEESEACDRRNKMRKTIRKCFQRIEVVTLPVPHHNASERGLTPDDALLPKFMEKVDRLKELIGKCCISPKALVDANGNKVSFTGSMIPTYLKNICDATRDPDLKLSPPDMMQALIAKLGKEAMSSLEKFASTIHVNLPLEDNALSIELAKVKEEFKKLKQRELEKSPIVKSDEFNRRCNELLESKLVEIRNKNSILMEKQIAQEKARRETERAENEALGKKVAEEKARVEGERAESEKKKKLKAENKAHMAEVKFRKVVKQADEDRKFMESQVEHATRLVQTAQEDNQKIRAELEVVSHEAQVDKEKMNAKLQEMHVEVADANARAQKAQTQAAADRDTLNAKVDKLQNELDDARQHGRDGRGPGRVVWTPWGPMLLH